MSTGEQPSTPSERGGKPTSTWHCSIVTLGLLAAAGVFSCGWARLSNESLAAAIGPRENDPGECGACHEGVAERYENTAHAARHILCGQCHGGAEHPNPDEWVTDGTCAGCHMSQYEGQLGGNHFVTRALVDLGDHVFGAQDVTDEPSFFVSERRMLRFAGLKGTGGEGGLLCAGCHYAGHRFALDAVRQEGACESCHSKLSDHYPSDDGESGNRCIPCHVFQGRTRSGQVINSHRFQVARDAGAND